VADDSAAPTRAQVVVIGAGIAGTWLAFRLARRGVRTVLIADDAPPLSRQAAGLIDQRVVDCTADTAAEVFADISTTQDPAYPALMVKRARAEFDELARLVDYDRLDGIVHPRGPVPGVHLGAGGDVVDRVSAKFAELGGTRLRGRVTDLVVDGGTCVGVRYQRGGTAGAIRCADVVFASGGFCGLLADGVGAQTGRLLGTYARHGGLLANLELFNRFALGDLDRRRPLYPFDLAGARLLRVGEPATELAHALGAFAGPRCDLEVFTHYWTGNIGVAHTAELAGGPARLGPVKGFGMGGMATAAGATAAGVTAAGVTAAGAAAPRRTHAVGECAYGLSTDVVTGKPFLSFLAAAAELADTLDTGEEPTGDLGPGPAAPAPDPALRRRITEQLDTLAGNGFTAAGFVRWCRDERARRRTRNRIDTESVDLLILAEAYARSVAARQESRGFFYRPDFPAADPGLADRMTLARYDADADEVQVSLTAVGTKETA
jgi:hypothetical protein